MALKVVIVDGVLYSKLRKQKEQERERGDWLDKRTAMNDGRSASPSALSRCHLGQINGAGLTETTAVALRGGGGYVCKRRLLSVGRTDRNSGVAESEVSKGCQVKKLPPPPTSTDRYSGVAVSGVGVAQGKRKNREELRRTDSRERRMMWCWSA